MSPADESGRRDMPMRWNLAHGRRRPGSACVLGDIDLVRALGLGGIRSDVVAPPGSLARFSRHTRPALAWYDPWERADEGVGALVGQGGAQPAPPVLFYEEDSS